MQDKIIFQLETSGNETGNHGGQDNTKLSSSIDNLITQMSAFNTSVKDFTSSVKTINSKTSKNSDYEQETRRIRATASAVRNAYMSSDDAKKIEQARINASLQSSLGIRDRNLRLGNPDIIRTNVDRANASLLKSKFMSSAEGIQLEKNRQTNQKAAIKLSKSKQDFMSSAEGIQLEKNRQNLASNKVESDFTRYKTGLQKQTNISDFIKQSDYYRDVGDEKFSKEILRAALGGIKDIKEKTAGMKVSQIIAAMGGVGLVTASFNKLMTADVSAGNAMMQNPLTSGYNYGGQIGNLMNAQQQRQNAYVGVGSGIAGGLASLVPGGAIIGAGIMGAGQIYGAYSSAQTSLKATAAQTFINNSMNMQSLSATNQAANGISSGGKYNITDAQQPLIMAMKRGAAVYNRNFTSIDKLTDYAIATQMSIQQAGSLAGNVGFLTHGMNKTQSNAFMGKMEQSFSAYGVNDYAGTTNTAIGLTQAGMSPSEAIEVASRSVGLNQGMQGEMASYYSDTISNRQMKDYISKNVFGIDLPNLKSGKGDPVATKYRNSLLKTKRNEMPSDVMAMGYEQSGLFNLTNLQSTKSAIDTRNIIATKDQNKFIASTNTITNKYAEGMTMDKAIGILNSELSGSTESLKTFSATVNSAAHALQAFISPSSYTANKLMHGTLSTRSGNTATKYQDAFGSPEQNMNRINNAPASNAGNMHNQVMGH